MVEIIWVSDPDAEILRKDLESPSQLSEDAIARYKKALPTVSGILPGKGGVSGDLSETAVLEDSASR
ncbi:hypothetical protein Lepto7375DRAFT_7258 [Leptolyngbya sp. PCC 7375]|nr:hypothetical protein Lepto7375DRAFT_7258 [Leptolyngbya sp. PCC 7375]